MGSALPAPAAVPAQLGASDTPSCALGAAKSFAAVQGGHTVDWMTGVVTSRRRATALLAGQPNPRRSTGPRVFVLQLQGAFVNDGGSQDPLGGPRVTGRYMLMLISPADCNRQGFAITSRRSRLKHLGQVHRLA